MKCSLRASHPLLKFVLSLELNLHARIQALHRRHFPDVPLSLDDPEAGAAGRRQAADRGIRGEIRQEGTSGSMPNKLGLSTFYGGHLVSSRMTLRIVSCFGSSCRKGNGVMLHVPKGSVDGN